MALCWNNDDFLVPGCILMYRLSHSEGHFSRTVLRLVDKKQNLAANYNQVQGEPMLRNIGKMGMG